MNTICGASCKKCSFVNQCGGCEATCGKPFGGTCVAAQYIKVGGKAQYAAFKQALLSEINALLNANDFPPAAALFELPGFFINLAYPLPSGETVKFLDEKKVYLGAQIALPDTDVCCGVVADTGFILICTYRENGEAPELIAYQKR